MNNTEKVYQELMNMGVGEVKHYYVVNYDGLIRSLRGTYIKLLDSAPALFRKGRVTITKCLDGINMKIFSEKDILIYKALLATLAADELKVMTEYLTELNTPDEVQQEPTPTLYRFTQHYFGVPKNSTFSLINGWLESDDPNLSLGSFITCTFWKDGKPEEITIWVTKSQIKGLVLEGVLKQVFMMKDNKHLNVLKFYWRLSEEGRKDHFKLVYQDPSVSHYRYKMDKSVVIHVPSKYAPYSDLIHSELSGKTTKDAFEIFRYFTDGGGFDKQEDTTNRDLNLVSTLNETNRLLRDNNELIKKSMEIVPRYKLGSDYIVKLSI